MSYSSDNHTSGKPSCSAMRLQPEATLNLSGDSYQNWKPQTAKTQPVCLTPFSSTSKNMPRGWTTNQSICRIILKCSVLDDRNVYFMTHKVVYNPLSEKKKVLNDCVCVHMHTHRERKVKSIISGRWVTDFFLFPQRKESFWCIALSHFSAINM